MARERRIPTSDALAPPAIALRHERAEIIPGDSAAADRTATVTIPLKGRRRALGTIIMDGVRLEEGSPLELLDRADEMGRQLSGAIENVLLLEEVVRSRRELENTFDALAIWSRCRPVRLSPARESRFERAEPAALTDQPAAPGRTCNADFIRQSAETARTRRERSKIRCWGQHAFSADAAGG
jgi:hypothetical protein